MSLKSSNLAGTFILSPLVMSLIHQGFPGKLVLIADSNSNGFILSKKLKAIADLKTQKAIIAVTHPYSQQHVLLHMVLKQNSIPEDNIKVLAMLPEI